MAYVKVPPAGCEYAAAHKNCCYCCPQQSDFRECECSECSLPVRNSRVQNLEPMNSQAAKSDSRFLPAQQGSEMRKVRVEFESPCCRPKCQKLGNCCQDGSADWSYCQNVLHENPCVQCCDYNCDAHFKNREQRAHTQVLTEIQCHPQCAQAAPGVDNSWQERQQFQQDRQHYQHELDAVRSQLRSLRNHSAIALQHKEPGEAKRIRRESGGVKTSPSCSEAALKRPRDLSPKPRSVSSQSATWLSHQPSSYVPESEQSDATLGEEEGEDEDAHKLIEIISESGSNTPSLVGETLGGISLSEPSLMLPHIPANTSQPATEDCSESQDKHVPEVPPLRDSLFSFVPPFVKFNMPVAYQGMADGLPPEIHRLLKWKLSPITPLVVRRTLLQSNFKLIRTSNEWCGTWGKHMKSACFSTIKDFQKMNHFPGTFQIGRKDRLWNNLHRLMLKYGKDEFGFIPRTFILPQDIRLLRQEWEKSCGIEQWIVKPPASARGTGIRVVHKWSQIPKKRPIVVQRYIAQPYLINGSKFDLRLYVFVSSIEPLRIYLYDDGLVRFASVKYSSEMSSLGDRYMHLTNYSINKNSSQYTQNENAEACQGHKWTVKALWSYLAEQCVDTGALWSRLEDLVVKTLISGEAAISTLIKEHVSSRYSCYELFGVDVLLDSDLRPWLLEVNISPSLHSSSPLDQAVKGPLVCDLLNMAGYHIPNKLPSSMQKDLLKTLAPNSKANQLCLDSRIYHMGLSTDEAKKQLYFTTECTSREQYLGEILQSLSSDDVRHLIQAEDELTQAGSFIRIFPTTDSHKYHKFFEAPRYYNMLFDAWEARYNCNRAPGIDVLEDLCQQKFHLIIPALSARAKSCAELQETLVEQEEEEPNKIREPDHSTDDDQPVPRSTSASSKIVRFLAQNVLRKAKRQQRYPRYVTTCRPPSSPRYRVKPL